nr:hypothetical protein GCM10020092_039870 [Actinoplanes digitatis]
MAGTALLMQRYSGQDDVPLGTVWSARDTEGLADLIGFFPNTVVLRTDVSGEPSFRELLRRTAAANRADLANADLPFDALVQELAPARTPGSTPFFRVYVNIDEAAVALPEFAGLSAEAIPPDFSTARFELGFVLRPGAAEPEMDSVFSTELFDTGTVERMLAHLVRLWQEALAAPDRPVSELSMLTDAELTDAVWTWNDTGADLGADRCLHELFEEQADAAPDRTALVSGDTTLSYGELDRRANRLAHRLRDAGVSTGDLVGVCLHRGIDQPVAVLAVLKAGGAFVPLDPDYPAERLEFMCRDADLWGVLTEPTLAGRVGDVWTVDVTEPDPDRSDRRPDAGVGPDDLAYVIYTSGSTGTPKGIGLRHAGAVNNFTDFNTRFALGTGEALLAVSSPSFDMSVYDLLGTVGCGGTVVLPTQDELRDPGAWARLIRAHGVTVWHSAPALLDLLLEHAERHRAELHSLRLALLGGDWIPVAQPDRLRAVAPGVRFIALGGATEASMDSIIFEVSEVDEGWASIPYGRPMANQRAYVLDRFDNPQPAGVPGELNLAGAGLARGYLGRPELTAEKFVERTLPGGRTERLYRTGDLARYRRDGVIELLGLAGLPGEDPRHADRGRRDRGRAARASGRRRRRRRGARRAGARHPGLLRPHHGRAGRRRGPARLARRAAAPAHGPGGHRDRRGVPHHPPTARWTARPSPPATSSGPAAARRPATTWNGGSRRPGARCCPCPRCPSTTASSSSAATRSRRYAPWSPSTTRCRWWSCSSTRPSGGWRSGSVPPARGARTAARADPGRAGGRHHRRLPAVRRRQRDRVPAAGRGATGAVPPARAPPAGLRPRRRPGRLPALRPHRRRRRRRGAAPGRRPGHRVRPLRLAPTWRRRWPGCSRRAAPTCGGSTWPRRCRPTIPTARSPPSAPPRTRNGPATSPPSAASTARWAGRRWST